MSRALTISAVLSRLWTKNTIKYLPLSVCPPAEYILAYSMSRFNKAVSGIIEKHFFGFV